MFGNPRNILDAEVQAVLRKAGWTKTDLAQRFQTSVSHLNRILWGETLITDQKARDFWFHLGQTATYWSFLSHIICRVPYIKDLFHADVAPMCPICGKQTQIRSQVPPMITCACGFALPCKSLDAGFQIIEAIQRTRVGYEDRRADG